MSWIPEKKATIFIPTGGALHLFVIVTDKCKDGCHLAVNMSKVISHIDVDQTCILAVGEHPFVTAPTVMMYGYTDILNHAELISCVQSGRYKPYTAVSEDILKRIRDGVLVSNHTPPPKKNYYRRVEGLLVVEKKRNIKKPASYAKPSFPKTGGEKA